MTTLTETTTGTWVVDRVHSLVEFSAKHMMVATVKGRFDAFEGTLHINEEQPENSRVTASVDVASIDTAEPQRDAHLRSDDFFNAEKFRQMTFHSKRVEKVDDEHWRVIGDLTIRDVTKEVVLDTEYEGQIKDAFGKQRAGFTATVQVNRKDFGLNWNGIIETGGVIVGDKVKIALHISAVRQD